MKKEFAVPPVVFPSGGNAPTGGSSVQQRRVPAAPFQSPRSSTSSIPFLSFDINSAAASTTSGGIYGGPIGGGSVHGGANFEYEEPLLDELGIHPDQIWKKTKSVLNPFRLNPTVHRDSDLSGPILLYIFFCLFQLLAGKIQFGVILGWIVVSSIFLYMVFNMLAGRNGNLDLHTCTSVVGYCMLPVVIFSAMSLFIPQGGVVRLGVAGIFVLWATRICTGLMVSLADGGEEHLGLIAYANDPTYGSYRSSNMAVVVRDSAPYTKLVNRGVSEMEDEEEDLFEIDLDAANQIPLPNYMESYFKSATGKTGNALLANCLLPISHISNALPMAAKEFTAKTTPIQWFSSPHKMATEPVPLGILLRLPYSEAFCFHRRTI